MKMKRLASPVSGSRQGALGLPLELRGAGQSRGDEVGHQLEHVEVGVVEVLRLAGHDPQHAQRLRRPGPSAPPRWNGRPPGGRPRRPPGGRSRCPGRGGACRRVRHSPERLLSAGGPGSLRIGAQAADGPVHHDVALGHLDGGPVGVGHRLDPVEDDADGPVGGSRRQGVDQTLGLDDVVQQVELRFPCGSRHGCAIGRAGVALKHNFLWQRPRTRGNPDVGLLRVGRGLPSSGRSWSRRRPAAVENSPPSHAPPARPRPLPSAAPGGSSQN